MAMRLFPLLSYVRLGNCYIPHNSLQILGKKQYHKSLSNAPSPHSSYLLSSFVSVFDNRLLREALYIW